MNSVFSARFIRLFVLCGVFFVASIGMYACFLFSILRPGSIYCAYLFLLLFGLFLHLSLRELSSRMHERSHSQRA